MQVFFLVVILGVIILLWIYFALRFKSLNEAFMERFNDLNNDFDTEVFKEAKQVVYGDEPLVAENDFQKIMEYSPSKKERQRRKHKKDGDN